MLVLHKKCKYYKVSKIMNAWLDIRFSQLGYYNKKNWQKKPHPFLNVKDEWG